MAAALLVSPPAAANPDALVRSLERTTAQLHSAIERWERSGARVAPRDVQRLAHQQQRLYMRATADAPVGNGALRRLRPPLRAQARDIVAARRALVRLTPPTTRPLRSFRVGRAPPPERLLAWYRVAERRFGVPWHVLAAVNFVESAFGKLRSPSSAGAQGPMQFLPATWRAYGLGGDIHDPHDAIMGAANYLRANGAPRTLWRSLYRYNPSRLYVSAVIRLARVIRRDPRYFRAFHSWRVYVRTPAGPRRVTDF